MPSLRPFAAVFYNKDKVENLANVFCPPYDVISSLQQDDYYKQNPYNFIRLELTKGSPKDNLRDNKYTRAKKTYEEWFKKGILKKDEGSCIYFYKQDYTYQGQKYIRMGFLGLLRISDDSDVQILPHEHTHALAKTDRFTLWSALKSNLSPIFVGYADRAGKIDHIFLKDLVNQAPMLETVDPDKVRHRIWRLSDPDKIEEIARLVDGQNLFICDGHHRFEVADQIRREALKKSRRITGEEPYNYVMAYFTNLDSKDLQIFPIHRIVKKFPISVNLLEQYFRIDKVKTKTDWLILLARAGQNEHAFGLYNKQGMFLLRLKNKMLIDKMVHEGSHEYRGLDTVILKAFILDQVGTTDEDIVYSKDPDEVIRAVNEAHAEAGFILNPVSVKQLRSVALNGERMPPKTTYFYPKVLSGLTIYKMN